MYNTVMMKTLNIVNGDACIKMMEEAGISGDFLPWHDFLHEGPVHADLTLEALSEVRAKFISDYGFGDFSDIKRDFEERDNLLKDYQSYDKVVLWFEHDLYDQLQLLQLLSWFATQELGETKLTLISTNNYLGESSIGQINKLLHYEREITPAHFQLAQKAWSAFCQKTPEKWAELLDEPTSLLPFLNVAVSRLLQEYPSVEDGLSRTAYQALFVISNDIHTPMDIFTKCQSFEERKFMGDIVFWKILEEFEAYGVVQKNRKKLIITTLGKELLHGKKNWITICPPQRYIGGVSLSLENLWCWSKGEENIKKYYYSKPLESLLKIKP